MNRIYRISVILLSAAVVFAMSNSPAAFGQRIRTGGGSNQGNKDKKDKDDDEKKDEKKNDNNNQGNDQNNQGGNRQGNQNNQGGNSNSGNAKKSSNSNVPSQFQPFIPGGSNKNDGNKGRNNNGQNNQGQNNQGQGGSNRFFNPGQQGFPGKSSNQQVIIGTNPGNAESANRRLGRWKGDQWEGTRKVDHWSSVFGVTAQPFSSKWYADHPSAWKYNNNKTNVWVVASVPGVYSWLGWGNVPQQYGVNYRAERFDPTLYGDWYPLGVYSLMSGEEDMGTRVVQLAVDRHGHINGNYFDMITSANNAILGEVDRNTQRLEFWLNRNPNVRFRASIARLLQPYGSITVRLPGGDQRWQFVRLEN